MTTLNILISKTMEDKKPILNFRGATPLKTVSINQHLKQPAMNNQLTIEDRVMKRNLSPKYRFTQHNHFQIIDILEEYRIKFNIDSALWLDYLLTIIAMYQVIMQGSVFAVMQVIVMQ